jgi:hypothetical protein
MGRFSKVVLVLAFVGMASLRVKPAIPQREEVKLSVSDQMAPLIMAASPRTRHLLKNDAYAQQIFTDASAIFSSDLNLFDPDYPVRASFPAPQDQERIRR